MTQFDLLAIDRVHSELAAAHVQRVPVQREGHHVGGIGIQVTPQAQTAIGRRELVAIQRNNLDGRGVH